MNKGSGRSGKLAVLHPMRSCFRKRRGVGKIEFFFQAFPVRFDGFGADFEGFRDFTIAHARTDQLEHLEFTIR